MHPLLTYANDQGAHVLIKNKNVGQLSSSLELENLELSNKAELAAPSDHLKLLTNKEFHQWLVGFSDAESNFSVYLRKDKKRGINFSFKIELHSKDINVLYFLKEKLECGTVIKSQTRRPSAQLVFQLPELRI